MGSFLCWISIALALAGVGALLIGNFLAAIAFGLFAYGAGKVGVSYE